MPPQADLLVRENISKNLIGRLRYFGDALELTFTFFHLDSDEYPATRLFLVYS